MGGIINAICAVQAQMNKTINDGSVDETCWWNHHGKDYFYDQETNMLKNFKN